MRIKVHVACLSAFLAVSGTMGAPAFGTRTQVGTVSKAGLNELSGLAASRNNPHVIWMINDSGPNAVYAVTTNGTYLGTYYINGFAMRDWEDIAIGPGPIAGVDYLYVGNIGDNGSAYSSISVARVLEPAVDFRQSPVTETLYGADIIRLQYASGAVDAETLMVDPWTKDIHIVTKRDGNLSEVNLFTAPYPQSTTTTITMPDEGSVSLSYAVGGDIAPSGEHVLIKQSWQDDTPFFNLIFPERIYHWGRGSGQTIRQALNGTRTRVPYTANSADQCEAVAWDHHDGGYYTISEGSSQPLYLYENLDAGQYYWLDTGSGPGGAVSPGDGWHVDGTNVTVSPTPDPYYHFAGWTGDVPGGQEDSDPLILIVDAPKSVQGNFAANIAPRGSPEWWLAAHGLTNGPFAEEEVLDGDSDGLLTWQEWICDTVPTDSNSVLRMTDVEPTGSGTTVHWKGGVQATQYLERCTDLVSEPWVPVFTNVPPTPVTNDFTSPDAVNGVEVYRIKARR